MVVVSPTPALVTRVDTGDAPAARDADTLWSRMVPPPPLHTTTCTVHPVLWLATTAPWRQYTTTTTRIWCSLYPKVVRHASVILPCLTERYKGSNKHYLWQLNWLKSGKYWSQ